MQGDRLRQAEIAIGHMNDETAEVLDRLEPGEMAVVHRQTCSRTARLWSGANKLVSGPLRHDARQLRRPFTGVWQTSVP